MPRTWRFWTKEEESFLASNWGERHSEYIAEKLGRTYHSVNEKAKRMGLGGCSRGTMSESQIIKITGSNQPMVRRVAAGLGIRLLRIPSREPGGHRRSGRRFKFDFLDALAIIEAIEQEPNKWKINNRQSNYGRWGEGSKPNQCIRCRRTKYPHSSRGLCTVCARPLYRSGEINNYPKLRIGRLPNNGVN